MTDSAKRKKALPSRAKMADEIEGWASGAYAAGRRPDILSATEAVADYWQEIVAALRGERELRVSEAACAAGEKTFGRPADLRDRV